MGACSIVVHAAMVMGFISCNIGIDSFTYYRPLVAQKLQTRFNIQKLRDENYLNWIDYYERLPGRNDFLGFDIEQKKLVALGFRAAMEQYLLHPIGVSPNSNPSRRCILRSVNRPTLLQFFDFAVQGATLESSKAKEHEIRKLNRG